MLVAFDGKLVMRMSLTVPSGLVLFEALVNALAGTVALFVPLGSLLSLRRCRPPAIGPNQSLRFLAC